MRLIFKNLCSLNNGSLLRKGIAMYFANYFDLNEEKRRLYKYFSLIDKDRNGMISFDELIEAFSFRVEFNAQFSRNKAIIELNKIYKFAGWKPENPVSFLEFFTANINFKKSMTQDHIKFLFNSIDIDSSE